MWYFVLCGISAFWVFVDARKRSLGGSAIGWAIGALLIGPILLSLYLAKRPLKEGEVREGGNAWNILKNFALFWTLTMAIAAVATMTSVSRHASTYTTDAEKAGAGVGTVLGLGLLFMLWFLPTFGAALIGFFVRKSSIVERGPTGPLLARL
jgi:hypothetical protein